MGLIGDALGCVQVVDRVTPIDNHDALCRRALAAGKDALVGKPRTITSKPAREIVEAVPLADGCSKSATRAGSIRSRSSERVAVHLEVLEQVK